MRKVVGGRDPTQNLECSKKGCLKMTQKEWLDEPNESGWWWCFGGQDRDTNETSDHLLVVRVKFYPGEENGTVILGNNHDFVGFTGESAGDITGKWQGPISEPALPI